MALVFEVQAEDIADLDDVQLTRLLKMLLHQETRNAGIAQRLVEVALNIRVADGGEDGRIQWEGGPDQTEFLPTRFVQFQNKATNMFPGDCANEIVRNGQIKPRIDEALAAGAAYILFTTQLLNTEQKDARIALIRNILRDQAKAYADTAIIRIYDAASIQGWVNGSVAAITAVLNWIGRPLVTGLQTWERWEQYEENHLFEFVPDEHRVSAIQQIRDLLAQPKESARLIGLSGLGKTRLALEICKGGSESDGFRNGVIYVDVGNAGSDLPGVVASWVQQNLKGTLIVDNCELSLHQRLKREINHPDSQLSLLTMHYNPEKDADSDPVTLLPMDDALIKSMLEPVYGERIPDLDRVVAFAQGFPQMAVLLAKARLDQAADMGSLNDDYLVQKMLWGGGKKNGEDEQMLQACALFEKFGLEDEAAVESQFIAENIARTDEDALYRCVKRFEGRGVVNSVGRYSQIIPKPLAIRLAADWWKNTRRKRQEVLIGMEMPGQLGSSFCNQIAKLDFLPEVKDLTADLCGDQDPFGQAEVILSDRGSRLFRALVEVNPVATSESLHRVFSSINADEIASITGDVRRNLVRSLEKLCFRKDTFDKSARILMALAANENESWSNNATGQFTQLFRVFLSGTASPPENRLALVDEAIQSGDEALRMLAVEALATAIDTYGASRMVGAEYQGSGAPLEEWRPYIWQEAFDYWIAAIERLTDLAVHDTNEGTKAKKEIGRRIRGLMSKGRDVMEALDRAIHTIIAAQGALWPEALESIKHSLSYDSERMPREAAEKLREWEGLLTPDRLEDKLKLFVSNPPFEHEKNEDGEYVDIAAMNAVTLAKELAGSQESLLPLLPILLKGEQRQGFTFGKELVEASHAWEPLASAIIGFAKVDSQANISLLLGMLSSVYLIDSDEWEQIVALFSGTPGLENFYPSVITTGQITNHHLETILAILGDGKLEERAVSILGYGQNLDSLTTKVVNDFAVALSSHSDMAGWVSLDLLSMFCHGDGEKFEASIVAFKKILVSLSMENDSHQPGHMDAHHWKTAATKILSKEGMSEFAVELVEKLVSSRIEQIDYSDIHHAIQPVMRIILEHYGRETWPTIGKAIVNASPLDKYRFTQFFGSDDHSDRGKHSSVLTELSDEILMKWCAEVPEIGPHFVATATEAFMTTDGDDFRLSPRAQILIDEYGDSDEVLGALSANMGSFGWTGSVVPHYENEVAAFEPLLEHAKPNVRNWADRRIQYLRRRIEHEKIRDAEHKLGIY
ncbi:MAG: hypothetical protein GY927_16575 [bacterium]|nr:hypothetical protein [bacterium]